MRPFEHVRQGSQKTMNLATRSIKGRVQPARFDADRALRNLMKKGRPEAVAEVVHLMPGEQAKRARRRVADRRETGRPRSLLTAAPRRKRGTESSAHCANQLVSWTAEIPVNAGSERTDFLRIKGY